MSSNGRTHLKKRDRRLLCISFGSFRSFALLHDWLRQHLLLRLFLWLRLWFRSWLRLRLSFDPVDGTLLELRKGEILSWFFFPFLAMSKKTFRNLRNLAIVEVLLLSKQNTLRFSDAFANKVKESTRHFLITFGNKIKNEIIDLLYFYLCCWLLISETQKFNWFQTKLFHSRLKFEYRKLLFKPKKGYTYIQRDQY